MLTLIFLAYTLPDPELTPGATDPAVTSANVHSTICVPGYTATVRNVSQATKKAVVRNYLAKHPDWPAGPYEIDHLISIELGGSNDIKNLWPQPIIEARVKDVDENRLHHIACTIPINLAILQDEIKSWDKNLTLDELRQSLGLVKK